MHGPNKISEAKQVALQSLYNQFAQLTAKKAMKRLKRHIYKIWTFHFILQ